MSSPTLEAMIRSAFRKTPYPGRSYSNIAQSKVDEGIVEYFRGTTWEGHTVGNLRRHYAAISFLTDNAFRYWLPAFMLAHLEDPDSADIIAESIAWQLDSESSRIQAFSEEKRDAVVSFLDHCIVEYGPADSSEFVNARTKLIERT
ncbi:MAG: DUF6714 family protein [Pseudomonadota bacterium]